MRHFLLILTGCLFIGFNVAAETADQTELYLEHMLSFEGENYEIMGTKTLTSREVGPDLATYQARVENCAEGLTHVRIIVSKAGLKVKGGGAIFSDGSRKNVGLTRSFSSGYTSPWISTSYLGANGRCVTSVFVNAHSTEAGKSSHVVVEGQYR